MAPCPAAACAGAAPGAAVILALCDAGHELSGKLMKERVAMTRACSSDAPRCTHYGQICQSLGGSDLVHRLVRMIACVGRGSNEVCAGGIRGRGYLPEWRQGVLESRMPCRRRRLAAHVLRKKRRQRADLGLGGLPQDYRCTLGLDFWRPGSFLILGLSVELGLTSRRGDEQGYYGGNHPGGTEPCSLKAMKHAAIAF